MNYILFDGTVRNALLPFTFTRPVADIRIGVLTIREKWEKHLGYTTTTLTEEYLSEKFPMVEMEGLNYSFSGIKTSFMYFLQKETQKNPNFVEENLTDICASMQHTLIKILLQKLKRASKETNIKEIAIAGGVSANSGLRATLQELGTELGWNVYIPAFQYCTDNAGMIAMAGHFKAEAGIFCPQNVSPLPRMEW